MILEGLCTTCSRDGVINLAPMGPVVDRELTTFLFRPFRTSTTFANLRETGQGVFHVTDDVELIARAAIGTLENLPDMIPAQQMRGSVLADCCRWFEFEVTKIDDSRERTEIQTRILHTGHRRDFWGFNRAKHAVLEAAILATRLHLVTGEEVRQQLERLAVIVEKTAGDQERRAFTLLRGYVADRTADSSPRCPQGQSSAE